MQGRKGKAEEKNEKKYKEPLRKKKRSVKTKKVEAE